MKKRLLIIPARKGSKRIKNKNRKIFFGKPIIEYAFITALKSKIFTCIHVSTDCKIIKKISKKYNLNTEFDRPRSLSSDKTELLRVFDFVVKKFKKKNMTFDEIWYLLPCSPLIKSYDLIKSSKFFNHRAENCMLAVSKYSPPIEWAFKKNKSHNLKPFMLNKLKLNSQKLTPSYYDTGTFGAFKANVFIDSKRLNYCGYEIPRYKGIDVDNIEDWILLKKVYKKL